ncbi:MAG: MFS transporter [Cyclobacteriaceae bacterium]
MNQTVEAPTQSIYTLQFVLLCLSGFLFFGSFNLIIPELPNYLTSLGGAEYKGLIIALFTLTAGLSRPFSGKLADKVGRVPVMIVGAMVSGIAALMYPVVSSVFGFFLLRFFHGFSTGFKPTGTSAYVADIIPVSRRGEAMGILGFFSSIGMAVGPAIGAWLASSYGLNVMFYVSSAFAISSVAILIGMKETLPNKESLRADHFMIKPSDIYEPRVFPAALFMLLCLYPFGAILTVVPDFSEHLQIGNKGLFFTTFTLASLLVRFLAGKASDIYGRVPVLKVAAILLIISMLLVGFATSQLQFLIGAFIFGLGVGAGSPTAFAWTIDLSDEAHRGKGIATMYIALEIGIGMGAFSSGLIYQNDMANMPMVFGMAAVLSMIALIYLQFLLGRRTNPI